MTHRKLSTKINSKPLKYFSAWFCPFAHRTTLALEHHNVNYQWEESLGWEKKSPSGKENFGASERDEWWYHWKSPELLRVNPLGMVPTLLEPESGRSVTESIVCVEFVDEFAILNGSKKPSLLPSDPFERAYARNAACRINKTVTSGYYTTLVRSNEEEQYEGFNQILGGLRNFIQESKGDFYSGSTLGIVDCVLLPYAYRLYALEYYRGENYRVPKEGENGLWQRYHKWLHNASNLSYVKSTLPDKDRYLQHVEKYAEGKARSKVGNAVRRGVAAHDYHDVKDG